jgi:two-component system, cell cycle sensor histidine kinase and response regulator CckA
VLVSSSPAFEAKQQARTPWLIATTGVAAGALLGVLVWLLAAGRARARQEAEENARRMQERRASEQKLREADERLRQTLKFAGAGTWELDVRAKRLELSPECLEIFGGKRESSWSFGDWRRRVHPEDLDQAGATFTRALDASDPEFVQEYRAGDAALGWRWLLSTGRVERRPDGTPFRISGLALDITRRKQAEEALRRSERLYQAVLKSSPDFWSVLQRDGTYQLVSSSASGVVGWSGEELLGESAFANVHPEDRERVQKVFRELRDEVAGSRHLGYRFRHKDGTWRILDTFARNLLDDPDVRGIVLNRRDVTDQRRLEEQLQQAQKLESVGRLAGGIAHDFNNILTVILTCAEEIKDSLAAGRAVASDSADDIVSAGRRASDLTRQLLAFARKQVIAPVILDLNEVVRGSEKLLRRVLGEDVALRVELQPGIWNTRCDRGQTEQIILNLAVNARDAMPRGGDLTVATANVVLSDDPELRPGEYVQLSVRDSGAGMTAEVKAHLFEPFFTTKAVGKGTGLGLATVYGIVKQSGGHVRVTSELGDGTTFEILLPRSLAAASTATMHTVVSTQRGDETILVVEDEPLVRSVTVRTLRGAGYTVLEASGAQEALAVRPAELQRAQLLITDVVMPDMNGRALAEALRGRRADLQVLYVSGYTRDAIAERGVLGEGIEFLAKPFTGPALLARVRQLLEARARAA